MSEDFYCDEALSGRTPVEVVAETDEVLAFRHTRPFWPVHIVVIPKRHVPSLVDLGDADETLLHKVLAVVRRLADEVTREHGACRVLTNLGRYQDSKHLHFHVNSGEPLRGSGPDSTAVRTALWRAMHVQLDAPPHVLNDEVGLRLVAPDEGWRSRPDMNPQWTRRIRASIVARARFIEDLVVEQAEHGVRQYVILGAGLDTFAQRKPEVASRLRLFEVDRLGPQAWKRQRLIELGYGVPEWLRFVAVDFEAGMSWWQRLVSAGFDATRPAVVASAGVSMYLTRDAVAAMLRQIAALAPGSTFAMTFLLPLELVESEDRATAETSQKGAAASGTPFVSFFAPTEMLALAREAGFRDAQHISAATLTERYFAGRKDGVRPSNGEELLVATT